MSGGDNKTNNNPVKYNSVREYIVALRKRVDALKAGIPLSIAAVVIHGSQARRIFFLGEKSDGTPIGKYNDAEEKPLEIELYVSPWLTPVKLKTTGKHGEDTFKSGKKHLTTYYSSYEDLRERQGKESGFVNLDLWGILRSDFTASIKQINAGEWHSLLSDKNIEKAAGNEKRFGDIFKLTKDERDNFNERMQLEYTKIMKGD